MDGDAAHVPLQWVMDVLKEARKKLSNPKLFVLSVLGVQSSGKSTMLNTIFGMQFNVSAGRCTRGAFMQLLQLDDDLKKKTKCSYVLIVDTEGLRGPEINAITMQKHDNELATFVIGLANMTLINIYGEITGDMDDILQTSVHAFIRMSEVKIYPSCKFVHQNAGMNINCEVGRAKLTEKLDKFAAAAAREEGNQHVNSFKDVINFNDTKDFHYFPGLWKGEPPMAPVDHGYSEAAQVMKQQVIDILEIFKGGILLSDFCTRLSDLWKGLLKENFVFSFRNTMEITYYNELETSYQKWEWEFQESMIQWQQTADNKIETEPIETLNQMVKVKLIDLQNHVVKEYKSIKCEMDEYCAKDEILPEWKKKFYGQLDDLKTNLKKEAESRCQELKQNKMTITELEKKKREYTALVTSKVQEHIEDKKREQKLLQKNLTKKCLEPTQLSNLVEKKLFVPQKIYMYKEKNILNQKEVDQISLIVQQYGDKLTEKGLQRILVGNILKIEQINKILELNQGEVELMHKFNEFWSECISKLPPPHHSSSSKVRDEVENSLIKHVGDKGNSQIVAMLQNDTEEKQVSSNVIIKFAKNVLGWFNSSQPQLNFDEEMKKLKDDVIREVDTCMQNFHKLKTDFNPAHTAILLKAVDKVIDTNQLPHLLSKDKYSIYCTVCDHAVKMFEEMADTYHKQNDPRLYLEKNVRGPLFTKFKNTYQQIQAEKGISDTTCAYLEEPIKAQVRKYLSVEMVSQMKSSNYRFFSDKAALKVKVLRDLYVEDNFQSYLNYLINVKNYLQDKLKSYTIAFCSEKSPDNSCTRLLDMAKQKASQLIKAVEDIVTKLTTTNIQKFLEEFNDRARVVIGATLSPKDILSEYDPLESVNLTNLKENILSRLKHLKVRLHDSLSNITCKEEMKHWEKKPHDLLQNIIGCTEQCPFCGEQCDLKQPDHDCDHSVEIHRVDCLKGYKWKDTRVMTTDFCQVNVSSDMSFAFGGKFHPYKDYKTIYPKWGITPDKSCEASLYWKSFVGKYYKEIAEVYNAKPADVPKQWSHIEWTEIEQNLHSLYNLSK